MIFSPNQITDIEQYAPDEDSKSVAIKLATIAWNLEQKENLTTVDPEKFKAYCFVAVFMYLIFYCIPFYY